MADPATPPGYTAVTSYNRRLAADCRARSGPMYDHVDNLSVVRDIDALRAALGEARLTFFGVSYGTLMGQQYAQLFPRHVRALALDSNEDHAQSGTAAAVSAAAGAEDSFTQFAQWCARDTGCILHGRDVGRLLDRLYARALAGTLSVPGQARRPLAPSELLARVEEELLGPDWAALSTALAALAAEAVLPGTPPGPLFPEEVDVYAMAAMCADWPVTVSSAGQVAGLLRRLGTAAPHLHLDVPSWQWALSCLGRPEAVTNPPRPYRIPHGVPAILMANGLHDPATPYPWALDAARQIPQAVLVTYDGWGHGTYSQSPCVRQIVDAYLIDLRTPPGGTHCPAVARS
jgi:pimeloyl-ACP methyl ester carboxylesterase